MTMNVMLNAEETIASGSPIQPIVRLRGIAKHFPGVVANQDVDFDLLPGEIHALLGENGAGKSTLIKLITFLYRPTQGRILVNGLDAARYSPSSLRAQMSTVFQDFGQYQMTVRENIALGDVDAVSDDPAVEAAAERAGADGFIEQLPTGYDNMLGRWFEGGRQLSGGQWQRLALARLYFRGGSVLIFDEPTAALDADAEFEVIETLRAHSRGRITIIVSHRFSTVRMAERIVVLEAGRVVEQGTHDQLLGQHGVYARMFLRQARGYLEGYDELEPEVG